ncbi:MLO-like protein 8 [Hibiscus syriacus]|uniref:MLO-like protein 8 n=1 Tax=Hibiscus syriacus TaxID=106335 RepID=A0A6A3ALZ1_HIBSY|nr:MLO-like protein 8 [Hibiscus syriacus]
MVVFVGFVNNGGRKNNGNREFRGEWAVAGVCAVIIIISITLEKVLHKLETWFTERRKRALFEALYKLFTKLFHVRMTAFGDVAPVNGCFFRQFFKSVGRVDYLTLRNGFINVHLAPGNKFNFQKYIKRSLEDNFKIVIGVYLVRNPVLWASFVVFLLLNVKGWQALFWASLIPVIIILAVGTELQAILTKMALEITERHAVVQGMPLYSFGMNSCSHADFELVIVKLAVGVLLLCSYITLPLYALVTKMGSRMKMSIFDEQTSKALKNWHMAAKKRRGNATKSPTRALGGSVSPSSTLHSPGHSLCRFKTTGHSTRSSNIFEDHDLSDLEAEPLNPASIDNLTIRVDHDKRATEINENYHVEARNEDDFSFTKSAPVKET